MKYKLLLTDLDATLLNDNKEISYQNKIAIDKALKSGIKTVICSGRSYMSLDKFVKQLSLDRQGNYGICYNGAIIYETLNNNILVEHNLKKEYALEVINECKKFDTDIIVYMDEKLIIEKYTEQIKSYCETSGITPLIVDNFNDIIINDVSKVLLKSENENLNIIFEHLKLNGFNNKLNMFFSSPVLFEFTDNNVDKGTGLCELAKILNIDKSEVIAVGDQYNDISMIEEAGLGIAVANAVSEAKKAADYITIRNNNESALEEVIEKFIL